MGLKNRVSQDKEVARYYRDDFVAELIADHGLSRKTQPTTSAERLEAYHGTTLPPELRQFLTMRDEYEFEYQSLGEWRIWSQEFWLPDPGKGNLAEQLISIDQGSYLGTCMLEYFAWCIRLGSAGNGDEYFAAFDRRHPDNTEVVFWDHETRSLDFYIADSISSLAYANHLLARVQGEGEFDSAALKIDARRIARRTSLSWHYGDLEEAGEIETSYKGGDVARYLYYRALWIVRLLQRDQLRTLSDTPELFGLVDVPSSAFDDAVNNGNLGAKPATAFYWLWRHFWLAKADRLQTTIGLCRTGTNPLIDDMADLIEELQAGRKQLGTIEDIHALRDEFLRLDLDPDRAPERERERNAREAEQAAQTETRRADARGMIAAGESFDALTEHAWQRLEQTEFVEMVGDHLLEADPDVAADAARIRFIRDNGHDRDGCSYSEERDEVLDVLARRAHPRLVPYLAATLPFEVAAHHRDPRLIEHLRSGLSARSEYNHELQAAVKAVTAQGAAPYMETLLPMADEFVYDPDEFLAEYGRKGVLWQLFAAFAESGDPRAVPPMVKIAQSGHKHLAARALVSLGRLGDVQACECALTMLSGAFRRPAMFCLARTGDERALDELSAMVSRRRGARERRIYEELMVDRLKSRLGRDVSLDNALFALQVIEANKYESRELHETAVELIQAHGDAASVARVLLPQLDTEHQAVRDAIARALAAHGHAAEFRYYDRATVDRLHEDGGTDALNDALGDAMGVLKHNLVRKAAELELGVEVEEAAVAYGETLLRFPLYSYTYVRDKWDRLEDGIEAVARLATARSDEFARAAITHGNTMVRGVFQYGFDELKQRLTESGPIEPRDDDCEQSVALRVEDVGTAPWSLGGGINGLALTPDRRGVVVVGGSGGAGGEAAVFNRDGNVVRRLPCVRGWAYDVDVHPDGVLAAIGLHAGHLLLVDISTGELVCDLQGHGGVPDGVRKVRFSPSGDRLVSASDDESLIVWDVAERKLLRKINDKFDVNTVDWFPDGRRVVFGTDKQIGIVDVEDVDADIVRIDTGGIAEVRVFAGGERIAAGGSRDSILILDAGLNRVGELAQSQVARIRVSADDQHLFAASWSGDPSIVRWSIADGSRTDLPDTEPDLFALDVDREDNLLFAGGKRGTVKVWDAQLATLGSSETAHRAEVSTLEVTGSGMWSASEDGSVIQWSVQPAAAVRQYAAAGCRFDAVAISPDGAVVVATGSGGAVAFDASTGAQKWRQTELERSEVAAAVEGAFVVGSGAELVWLDAESGEIRHRADTGAGTWIHHLIRLKDDRFLAAGYRKTTLSSWDLGGRECVGTITLPEHMEKAETYGFGAGGDKLVVSRWDRSFDLLERDSLNHTCEATQLLPLAPLAVSPDGRWLAAGEDKLRIFDTDEFAMRATRALDEKITALAFADPNHIAVGLASGRVSMVEIEEC